ncbi:MAG: NAD(P)/FAD-dependent oxidoreductase [Candidatus Acidiferrales bacterium]
MRADVLVVGGGPAGIATAIAASLKGFRVTVIDFRQPPIDKPCGEGLLPEGVAALRSLGIELNSSLGFPLSGFRFSDEESSASAMMSARRAFGLRRTMLHRLLIDRASEVGVSFLWGARVSRCDFHGVSVNGDFLPCEWLVGADGQSSIVRDFTGLGPLRRYRHRFGFRRHYAVAPWTDCVEVHWGERAQMIATPIGAGEICVSLFSSDARLRLDRALELFPDVAKHLRDAHSASTEAGAVTSLGRARAVVRRNIALVGDASCTVDGIAGQGLSLAFPQALHLADALARGDLAQYESAHRRITDPAIRMTRLLLAMNASAALRRKVLRLFAACPAMFSKMISIHTGEAAPSALNIAGLASLGWRVLWA